MGSRRRGPLPEALRPRRSQSCSSSVSPKSATIRVRISCQCRAAAAPVSHITPAPAKAYRHASTHVLSLGACLSDDRAVEGVDLPRRPKKPLAHLELPHGVTQVRERDRLRLADDLVHIKVSRGAVRRCDAWPCAAQSGRCRGEGGDTAGESCEHGSLAQTSLCGCKFALRWRRQGAKRSTCSLVSIILPRVAAPVGALHLTTN